MTGDYHKLWLQCVYLVFIVVYMHRLTDEGVYPAMAESIAECLSVRREELRQHLIQSSCAISHDHLVDLTGK